MDVNNLLQEKRTAILQLAAKHGARNVGCSARWRATRQTNKAISISWSWTGRTSWIWEDPHGPAGTAGARG